MVCDTCHGRAVVDVHTEGGRVVASSKCPDCGGTGMKPDAKNGGSLCTK